MYCYSYISNRNKKQDVFHAIVAVTKKDILNNLLIFKFFKRKKIKFHKNVWEKTQFLENSLRVERLRLGGVVPKEKDLHGAAQALIRLQVFKFYFYKLKTKVFN